MGSKDGWDEIVEIVKKSEGLREGIYGRVARSIGEGPVKELLRSLVECSKRHTEAFARTQERVAKEAAWANPRLNLARVQAAKAKGLGVIGKLEGQLNARLDSSMTILEFAQPTEEECLSFWESILHLVGDGFGIEEIVSEEKGQIEKVRHLTYTTLAGFHV